MTTLTPQGLGSLVRLLGPGWRDRAALERCRDRRVRRLVRHAYERVPFYRRRFAAAGVHPDEIGGVADLRRLPLVEKRDLQGSEAGELLAAGLRATDLIERRTTGSTGEPLRIRRTWLEERCLGALRWRTLHAFGLRATDRHAEVEELVPLDRNDGRWLHQLAQRFGVYRQARIDALADPEEILARLRAFSPQVLTGYAGVLARVARVAGRDHPWRPRFVGVHSDTLTAPMRSAIEAGFRAPVCEIYDANEFNVIAWECRVTGELHVRDDAVVLEVLRDGRPAAPGEVGEVVATALHSFAMPFVRYRIGDRAAQGSSRCPCGSPMSTIRGIEGRTVDYFPLADGRTIHPYEIIAVLSRTAPWMLEYRLLQERRDRVSLRLVASTPPPPAALDRVRREVGDLLGPRVELHIERVDRLPGTGGVCRSLVSSEYGQVG